MKRNWNVRPTKSRDHAVFAASVAAVVCLGWAPLAWSQNPVSYVDGVSGDDANSGTLSAPCLTLQGAISKTVDKGEVNFLSPGRATGFGAVVITNSVTIDGAGTMAAINTIGRACVVISAGSNDVVTLRNLSINLNGNGTTYGVLITSARLVEIEKCVISGGVTNAIDFQPSTSNATLRIRNCHIYACGGTGVAADATGGGGKVVIEDSSIIKCARGILATTGTVTLNNTTVSGCSGAGLASSGNASILTHHNNRIFGNNPDGNPTGSLPLR